MQLVEVARIAGLQGLQDRQNVVHRAAVDDAQRGDRIAAGEVIALEEPDDGLIAVAPGSRRARRPLGIVRLECRDGHHIAVLARCAQRNRRARSSTANVAADILIELRHVRIVVERNVPVDDDVDRKQRIIVLRLHDLALAFENLVPGIVGRAHHAELRGPVLKQHEGIADVLNARLLEAGRGVVIGGTRTARAVFGFFVILVIGPAAGPSAARRAAAATAAVEQGVGLAFEIIRPRLMLGTAIGPMRIGIVLGRCRWAGLETRVIMDRAVAGIAKDHAVVDAAQPAILRIGRVAGLVRYDVVSVLLNVVEGTAANRAKAVLAQPGLVLRRSAEVERSCHIGPFPLSPLRCRGKPALMRRRQAIAGLVLR